MEEVRKILNKDFKYVYFIENHIINSNAKISLGNNSNGVKDLEEIPQFNYKNDEGIEFKCTLYRFKLEIKQMTILDVTINLEDNKGEIFTKNITIHDTSKDNYIYVFIFEPKKTNTETKNPPTSFIFSHCQQFEIYVNYLRKQNIKRQEQENIDLISSTQLLLIGKGIKYKFSFYLMVLLECFDTCLVQYHLTCLKAESIEEIGEIKDEKLKQTITNIYIIEEEPEKVLDNIKDIKDKEKNGINLFAVIIYFYYNFARDKLPILFSKKDESIQNYILQSLIEKRNELFINFKLTKEEIHNLMNYIKDIEQINIILTYYTVNLLELISIISYDFNTFNELYSSNINQKKIQMNIEEIIKLNENDNIKEIYEKYIELVKRQLEANKNLFFSFGISLLNKYIYIILA